MPTDQRILLTQIVTLIAVLDPVGHLALFLTTTAALDRRSRRRVAVLAVLISLAILTAFGFAGQYLLDAMGISLLSFQIAGGIVLFLYSLTMVLGEPHSAADPDAPGDCLSMAIHPLAVPIIAGPGSMLTLSRVPGPPGAHLLRQQQGGHDECPESVDPGRPAARPTAGIDWASEMHAVSVVSCQGAELELASCPTRAHRTVRGGDKRLRAHVRGHARVA
jgi:MarC family integral membrane protein